MSKPESNTDEDQAGLYPIRTVSNLTGVNSITLRAWERRHNLFTPVRKASGHRLYTQQHIDLINRVVGLLDRGMRIGQIKAHLDNESSSTGNKSETSEKWETYQNHMISSVIQFDEDGLEATYGEALSLYPIDQVTEELLVPTLKELGRRWEENEGSVAEEHFFSLYIRNKLGARFHHQNRSKSNRRLLLACLPGERHETGLLIFALEANDAGYDCILLGADIPLQELPASARKTGCDAIVLSGRLQPDNETITRGLPDLARQSEVPVFLGGHVSVVAHEALKNSDIHLLGTNIKTGLRRLDSVLVK